MDFDKIVPGTKGNEGSYLFHLVVPLFVGGLIGLGFLYYLLPEKRVEGKFEELALGKENTVSLTKVNGRFIHCHDLNDGSNCIDSYRNQNKDVVLWLGNSQVHAINQKKPGDETAAPILHRHLEANNKYLIVFSQPNASLQEHYLLFEYLTNQLPVTTLVLPVVFDDLRETGIRFSLLDVFESLSVSGRLGKTPIGRSLLANQGDRDSAGNDMTALDETLQEQTEEFLNVGLSSMWQVWDQRSTLRGYVMHSLYLFRNWIFGIDPSSTRKMLPGRYIRNMQAMEAILKSAIEQDVAVLLYIVPLRDDVKIPYELKQYDRFKYEVQSIAEKHKVKFVNLEKIVPPMYWGTKGSTTIGGGQELDFMHFQAKGHQLLADALYRELNVLGNEGVKE